jgi:hypothetical protein
VGYTPHANDLGPAYPCRSFATTGAFTARHWDPALKGESDPRMKYRDEPWYRLAVAFVDEWDMESFDSLYPHEELEHFAPLVRQLVTGA